MSQIKGKPHVGKVQLCLYIYIYRERERERERYWHERLHDFTIFNIILMNTNVNITICPKFLILILLIMLYYLDSFIVVLLLNNVL